MAKLKVGVCVSGRGSNLQALIDACGRPDFPAEIVLVVSNVGGVQGLERAEKAGIETATIEHGEFKGRQEFERAVTQALEDAGTELVCLAGFMRILSPEFCERWSGRLLNIHPSLLPAFKGLDVQQMAIDAGVRFSGCTVHFVTPAMDAGPIIIQAVVPILTGDTADALAARILEQEHRIYPEAVRLFAEDRLTVDEGRVTIADAPRLDRSLVNPPPK